MQKNGSGWTFYPGFFFFLHEKIGAGDEFFFLALLKIGKK